MSKSPRRSEREAMVEGQLSRRGIRDRRVLDALKRIPRHRFVPAESVSEAYADSPLPIPERQTISQPYIVAAMTEMLDLQPEHRVLEVGTGSGYQTAVLHELAGQVYTIEIRAALQESARRTLETEGHRGIHYRLGDGALGWPEFAPFDRIVVTACATEIPSGLSDQLAAQGRLVLPVGGPDGDQRLVVVTRGGDQKIDIAEGLPVRFVMMTSFDEGGVEPKP